MLPVKELLPLLFLTQESLPGSTNTEYCWGCISLDRLLGRTDYQVSLLSQRLFSSTLTPLKISDLTVAPKFSRKFLDPGKIRTYLNYTARRFQCVRQGQGSVARHLHFCCLDFK